MLKITPRRFWTLLLLTSAGATGVLYIWDVTLIETDALSGFGILCIAMFVLINILAYYSGVRAVHSTSKFRFVHIIMILIIVKMAICVGLVIAHLKINQPGSRLFVLPFLTTYLIFTVFEIYILEKVARTKTAETSSSHHS